MCMYMQQRANQSIYHLRPDSFCSEFLLSQQQVVYCLYHVMGLVDYAPILHEAMIVLTNEIYKPHKVTTIHTY